MVDASHFVEFYDEVLDAETYKQCGIATLEAISFNGKVDADAVALIEEHTSRIINDNKFCVSNSANNFYAISTMRGKYVAANATCTC